MQRSEKTGCRPATRPGRGAMAGDSQAMRSHEKEMAGNLPAMEGGLSAMADNS